MMDTVARPGARASTALVVLLAALFLVTVFSGCVGPGGEEAGGDEEPFELLFFEPGQGPGHEEALVNLTGDPEADSALILEACRQESDKITCVNEHLKSVLSAEGSVHAFDVLDAMTRQDSRVSRLDHTIAHVLGRHAIYVYGTIGETLVTCSHKVFQGCIHGALQEYFEHVDLENTDLAVCPEDATRFEVYACMHGLGHGLVLATDYDLARSLDLCATLETRYERTSCYGGAFMENVVAYIDSQRDDGHDHDHGGDVRYWVNKADPEFPCNTVDERYEPNCWNMQTSLILHLNRGNFQATATVCAGLKESLQDNCYGSLGRDAASWGRRDPYNVGQYCDNVQEDEWRYRCIRGAVKEIVTNYVDPYEALPFCQDYPAHDQDKCYRALGDSGRSHLDEEGLAEFCAQVDEGHRAACREGARL